MSSLASWERALPHLWQEVWPAGRAPILAAVAALAALLAGRLLRVPLLQAAASGVALAVGWIVAFGGVAVAPRLPAERLPVLALAGLGAGIAADLWRRGGLVAVVLAVAAGWWVAGAPRSEAEAAAVLPHMACIALAVLLAVRLLAAPRSPWVIPAAALALWGALLAARAPLPWTGLALVPLAATLGQVSGGQVSGRQVSGRQVSGPRGAWAVRLPMAAALAGLAALVVLVPGHALHGGVTRVDLAALAPVVAVWLAPRLMARVRWGGGLLAALLAAAVAVALAWGAGRLGLSR
jgi:hypothetical protein